MSTRIKQLMRARVTWRIVIFLLCVHFALTMQLAPDIYENFGLRRAAFGQGRPWTIFSYAFLHGNGTHIALNVVVILLLGSRLEWIIEKQQILFTLLCSIFSGGLFHLLLVPGDALLVGSSSAVMALLLLLCTLSPESRMLPLPLRAKNIGAGILISSLLLALMLPALQLPLFSTCGKWATTYIGPSLFQVGHACHFGGALAGWLCGRLFLRTPWTKESLQKDRERREKV